MSRGVSTCLKQPPSLQLPYSLLLLALLSAPRAVGGPTGRVCTLYEPPAPGMHCLHSDNVLQTITQSKWVWMLELYSSWCGHCQNFAPKYKEMAKDVEAWSEFVRIGVLECSNSANHDMCSKFDVGGFPTIRMFQPNLLKPLEYKSVQVGGRSPEYLRHWMVDEIASVSPRPPDWPVLDSWLTSEDVLEEEESSWKPSVLVFETTNSYLGKELILDLWHIKSLRVIRVPDTNTALILHYSILEFPSAVMELRKGLFHVIPGHSVEDPRSEFRSKILSYLHKEELPSDSRDKVSPLSQPALAPHKSTSPPPQVRVDVVDVLGAIAYALRAEVPLQTIISGSAYLSLYNFIVLLEQAFSKVPPVGVSDSLGAIRQKLDGRGPTGFITNKEWYRVLDKLDPSLFPTEVKWKACNGSLPHLRGYPCGLWTLMHTISLLTLPITLPSSSSSSQPPSSGGSSVAPINSARALPILSSFIQHFFSCEVCRAHFSEMAGTLSHSPISESGDAVLWLWEAHNSVNARLLREGGGDPTHPKTLFPSISHCPYCYIHPSVSGRGTPRLPDFDNTGFASGESLLEMGGGAMMQATPREPRHVLRARQLKAEMGAGQYVWNRTAVLLYLWNFYHLDTKRQGPVGIRPRIPAYLIVQAAWPGQFGVGQDQFYQRYLASRLEKEDFDPWSYLVWVGLCLLCLGMVGFWLQRRRRYRNRRFRW